MVLSRYSFVTPFLPPGKTNNTAGTHTHAHTHEHTVGDIEKKEHEADDIFQGLLRTHGNVPEVLRVYASYICDIKHDK